MEIAFVTRKIEMVNYFTSDKGSARTIHMSLPRLRCLDDDKKYSGPGVTFGVVTVGDMTAPAEDKPIWADPALLRPLTTRETEIYVRRKRGMSNAAIAAELRMTADAVRSLYSQAGRKIANQKITVDAPLM